MERNGFNYIMTNVCQDRAGAVAAWEASRLARSHFEWQKLIRFCKVSWTLVIDESGIYDPTNLDDMAMLGIKAALSEYELQGIHSTIPFLIRALSHKRFKRGDFTTNFIAEEDSLFQMDESKAKIAALATAIFSELGKNKKKYQNNVKAEQSNWKLIHRKKILDHR